MINVGIIGCGNIFTVHADSVVDNDKANLKYVVDINEEKAKGAAEKYNCQWHIDYKEVLKDASIDVIHICTPHYLHVSMIIDALRAGKNILVEKPVVMNTDEAERITREAENHNKLVGVCFQNRLNPTSLKIKELIDKKTYGEIRGIRGIVNWYRDKDYYLSSDWRGKFSTEGGGVLINQAIHTLDLMSWFGGKVKKIKGNVDTRLLMDVIEVEDTADATIVFENGAVGVFYATNCYSTNASIELEIHCEKAVLKIYEDELIVIEGKNKYKLTDDKRSDSVHKAYWGISHRELIDRFYNSVVNNTSDGIISIKDGMEVLKLIEGIYESSSKGEFVQMHD